MCGRFNLIISPQVLLDAFQIQRVLFDLKALHPRYNIAPTQDIPIVRDTGAGRELTLAQWGLVPHWSKEGKSSYSTINARAETVAEKPAYRDPFKRRRCLIPATGFYEWKTAGSQKIPHHIRLPGGVPFAFAGLWDHWSSPKDDNEGTGLDSCSIIVGPANAAMESLHDRMPIILHADAYDIWLDTRHFDRETLKALLLPYDGVLDIQPISTHVNNARHEGPECIAPAKAESL